MILGLVTLYVVFLTLLRLVYLLFKPKFLSEHRFGTPPKYLMVGYYLYMSATATIFALHRLGIITFEMPKQVSSDLLKPYFSNTYYWIIGIALVLATIHTVIGERSINRKKRESTRP